MKCECGKKAVYPNYCKEHFIEYFENKVKETIKKYKLLNKKDIVCVAASGGKDSLTVLHILNKFGYNISALAIDEGIKNYRDNTITDLKEFCEERKIPLKIVSFQEFLGKGLDNIVPKIKGAPCASCGTARRYLLNKFSKNFDVIATGHNMDDESQAMMMNLLKSNLSLLERQHIKTQDKEGFTVKIKPLYFMKEKEIRAYALLKNFKVSFTECPYVPKSFRRSVQEELNKTPELKEPLAKINLKFTKKNNTETKYCKQCGEPSTAEICNFCKLKCKI